MELAIRIQIEELPEGLFLATSDELPGLVAQGRTVAEALEIARDVARKLIEARRERNGVPNLPTTSERRDYTIVVAAKPPAATKSGSIPTRTAIQRCQTIPAICLKERSGRS
jgi:predicted RNase H-like HicB family nuclease